MSVGTRIMSVAERRPIEAVPAAIMQLESLSALDADALDALKASLSRIQRIETRGELFSEGRPIGGPWLILEGWTARVRQLSDGRRQLVSFGLPGDLIGYCQFEDAIASSTVVALNPVHVCPLPDAAGSPTLARAYAISRALDEAYLMAQVTRIGRLNVHERIVDLLLELYERLSAAGLARDGRFRIPLTQETLSDALGLTPVHLNRTLQQARRAGELTWTGRDVILHDPTALAFSVGHVPARVSARHG